MTHTYFTEITRVIFVHENAVVMLTARVTATGRVFAVLPDSTVTGRDVSTLLAVFVSVRFYEIKKRISFVSCFVVITSKCARNEPKKRSSRSSTSSHQLNLLRCECGDA